MNDCPGGLVFEILDSNVENGSEIDVMEDFITVTSVFYEDLEYWFDVAIERWAIDRKSLEESQ